MEKKRWFPLESNPAVMNHYSANIGADESTFCFNDVFGVEPELLMMIPQPCYALLLLFPVTDQTEEATKDAVECVKNDPVDEHVWFTRQTVGNACGTIGLLHALLNSTGAVKFKEGSILHKFSQQSVTMTSIERAAVVCDSKELEDAHDSAAQCGQTSAEQSDMNTNLHFVVFVHRDGALYELDGHRERPLFRGKCEESTFLLAAADVVKGYMQLNPESLNFGITALCASSPSF